MIGVIHLTVLFRPGRYTFRVPISQFVPVNMRVTLLMKWVLNTVGSETHENRHYSIWNHFITEATDQCVQIHQNSLIINTMKLKCSYQMKWLVEHENANISQLTVWVNWADRSCFEVIVSVFFGSSTELLVVHLCKFDESAACSALLDINTVTGIRYPSNTQVNHCFMSNIHHVMQSLSVSFFWLIMRQSQTKQNHKVFYIKI